jgi:hypothetical protein
MRAVAADRETETASSQELRGTVSPTSSPTRVTTRSSSARLTPRQANVEFRVDDGLRPDLAVSAGLLSVTAPFPHLHYVRNRVTGLYQAGVNRRRVKL